MMGKDAACPDDRSDGDAGYSILDIGYWKTRLIEKSEIEGD